MLVRFLCVLALAAVVSVGAVAASQTSRSAVAALVAYERSHYHNTDVEQPLCYVLQTWAQCSFGTGHGNAEVNAWLRYKSGVWSFLGSGGGVTTAQMLEKWYGIPPGIAREFQAKQ